MAGLSAKALRQLNNERTAEHFAVAMSGLIALFTIIYWSKLVERRYGGRQKGKVRTCASICSRSIRSIMNRKVPGFYTIGHLTVYILYIAINVTLTFTNMDWSVLNNFGKRLGWISTSNLTLTIFLSLKNTPLSFLAHYSHNALNILHRCAGYTVVIASMCHAVVYIKALAIKNTLSSLSEWANVAGIIAGVFFLLIAATATFLRRQNYEIFYISHILLFITIMIMLGFHQPVLSKHTLVVITFGSALWFSDRLIRTTRILYFSLGNFATIIPLENGGTRIILKRVSRWTKPGSHVFLWIPTVRKFETHPFTVVRTQSGGAEFVVAKQDGFTRDLYEFAVANPGACVRASIDGPYGTTPSFKDADKVILVAGGSGASYSAGVAVDLASRMDLRGIAIEFIWAVRDEAQLSWYSTELQELKSAQNVAMNLYCTNQTSTSTSYIEEKNLSTSASLSSKTSDPTPTTPHPSQPEILPISTPTDQITKPQNTEDIDLEKKSASATAAVTSSQAHSSLPLGLEIESGRPDLNDMIRRSIKEVGSQGRVVLCACGPEGMMTDVRKIVVGVLGEEARDGASLEMFLETFGW